MISERAKLFVGVDPGDKWIGVASIAIKHDSIITANMAVRNQTIDTFCNLVREIVPGPKDTDRFETVVITERYQERGSGYRRGNSGHTSQLVGAIRYVTEVNGGHWTEVLAADPQKELPKFPIYQYISEWMEHCPREYDSRWFHAWSAWRVISQYMLVRRELNNFQLKLRLGAVDGEMSFSGGGADDGFTLVAPKATWRIR